VAIQPSELCGLAVKSRTTTWRDQGRFVSHLSWRAGRLWQFCSRWDRRTRAQRYLRFLRPSAAFDINVPGMGLFAHLSWILLALDWSERNGYTFHFRCTSPQYNPPGRTGDWLGSVVGQENELAGRVFTISCFEEFPFAHEILWHDRAHARALFRRHLQVRPEIVRACDSWHSGHFRSQFVIGIHYRGSDKISEAPRVPHSSVIAVVREAVEHALRSVDRIAVFVATDDAAFLALAKESLHGIDARAVEDVCRAEGTVGVHNSARHDGSMLARQAMADSVLLSRSHLLIKTASLLSGWSAILGDDMPVVMVSKPHKTTSYYPDNILAPEAFSPDQVKDAVVRATRRFRGEAIVGV